MTKPVESAGVPPVLTLQTQKEISQINGSISLLEGQIKVKENEIASFEKQQRDVQANLNTLNSRVLSMPVGDQRLTELLRDESMAKDEYQKAEMRYRAAENRLRN